MKKLVIKALLLIIFIALIITGLAIFKPKQEFSSYYIASTTPSISLKEVKSDQIVSITRGSTVKKIGYDAKKQLDIILYEDETHLKELYIEDKHLVSSLIDVVLPHLATIVTTTDLRLNEDGKLANKLIYEDDVVMVEGLAKESDIDILNGNVSYLKILYEDEIYYLPSHYLMVDISEKWQSDINYSDYWDMFFGEGYSQKVYDHLNYQPMYKPTYQFKQTPDDIRGIYMSYHQLETNLDAYIDITKQSGINAFVIEMKSDSGLIPYQSSVVESYFNDPSQVIQGLTSKDDVRLLLNTLKENNIYAIARVVAFKDQPYASAYPDQSLKVNGELFEHNHQYWPSPFMRNHWMYLIDYSKELGDIGFNEIQFDYVRFPDGIINYELNHSIDLVNPFNESKVQAIQRFLMFAKDELSRDEIYVAADLFAWNAIAHDDQNIGQFYPAISNVVDVINPMVYPDHFSNGNLGVSQPGYEPYQIISAFSQVIETGQYSLVTPAKYRPWIQGYHCMPHVCNNPPFNYGSDEIRQQVQALFDLGYHSYMIWNGSGEVIEYQMRLDGFIAP